MHLVLPCGPSAPGLARQALRSGLDVHDVVVEATLIVSELVTNAVEHSGCTAGETITLDVRISDGCLRISVRDPDRCARPGTLDSGLGLRLVEKLAHRWGSERAGGRLVWAELAACG
jgi:anti-sigma regulatory factor (Ser/Thr protein kinase)